MEAQKPLEQETSETTPQEAPTATIPQPESTPAANMEADPIPEEMDASPESPAKKTAGKLAALIGGGIVAVLGIFYLVLCIVSASHGTILGRTDVMGVDMSGLTVPQAQERWQQKGQAVCQTAQLPLTVDDETAGQVSLWELGVSVTPETAAQLAYDAGHSGHFLENGWSLLRSWFRETSLTPPWTADDAALQEKAAELAEQLDMAAVDGACRLEQGKEDGFLVTVPKNGRKIDLPRLTDALRAALAAGTLEPVTCAYEVVEAKPVDFDAFAETYATAKNASYNAAADQVEEGTVQVTFDADAAQKLVAQAQPGQEITVPAQIQQPKVSKAALEKVLFRDVLASCTTYVSGAWGRIQNVRKAAQNISGTVLNCGDQFSYNDAIGPTTADYGFYAAPGYVGGKTVDVYGGGVCQVSSTLYYATLKADLEIVMRYCHQYAPELAEMYANVETCPEELLLFFHHMPYNYVLKSGKTILQHIYDTHFEGAEDAARFYDEVVTLKPYLDPAVYARLEARFAHQKEHACEWRDVINTYFYRKTGIGDAHGRKIYE